MIRCVLVLPITSNHRQFFFIQQVASDAPSPASSAVFRALMSRDWCEALWQSQHAAFNPSHVTSLARSQAPRLRAILQGTMALDSARLTSLLAATLGPILLPDGITAGQLLLLDAAACGTPGCFMALLDAGIVPAPDPETQNTVLHLAADCDCASLVRLILRKRLVDPLAPNRAGSNAFLILVLRAGNAVDLDSVENVRQLFTLSGVDPDTLLYVSGQKFSFMALAILLDRPALVPILLSMGADPNGAPGEYCSPLATAVLRHCRPGEPSFLRIIGALLVKGANPDSLITTLDGYIEYPVAFAASRHETDVDRLLAEAGATLNSSASGDPELAPLLIALEEGYLDIALCLLEFGADPDIRNEDGRRLIEVACDWGDAAMLEALLSHGAPIEPRCPLPSDVEKGPGYCLAGAIQSGAAECIRILVQKGKVDPNAPIGTDLLPPLFHAALFSEDFKKHALNSFQCLLELGADPNVMVRQLEEIAEVCDLNFSGEGALVPIATLLLDQGRFDFLRCLAVAGADFDADDDEGYVLSPFACVLGSLPSSSDHPAALQRLVFGLRLLLDLGANPVIPDTAFGPGVRSYLLYDACNLPPHRDPTTVCRLLLAAGELLDAAFIPEGGEIGETLAQRLGHVSAAFERIQEMVRCLTLRRIESVLATLSPAFDSRPDQQLEAALRVAEWALVRQGQRALLTAGAAKALTRLLGKEDHPVLQKRAALALSRLAESHCGARQLSLQPGLVPRLTGLLEGRARLRPMALCAVCRCLYFLSLCTAGRMRLLWGLGGLKRSATLESQESQEGPQPGRGASLVLSMSSLSNGSEEVWPQTREWAYRGLMALTGWRAGESEAGGRLLEAAEMAALAIWRSVAEQGL